MTQLISAEAQKAKPFTLDNFLGYGVAGGSILTGLITAHVAAKALNKEESIALNGTMALGGFVAAVAIPTPWIKFAMLGLSTYGVIRTLNIAGKSIVEGTSGLGMIPDSVKAVIRKFLPSISGINGDNALLGEMLKQIDLGEAIDMGRTENADYTDVTNVSGIGMAELL